MTFDQKQKTIERSNPFACSNFLFNAEYTRHVEKNLFFAIYCEI